MCSKKAPDFLIVGAAKSGTTFLYHSLRQHPDIFFSEIKEPNYFSKIQSDYVIRNWHQYTKLFYAAKPHHIVGEASVSYLPFYKVSIPTIKKALGSPKIVIVLRNPVDRFYSHYMYYRKLGIENNSLKDVMAATYELTNDSWGIKNPYFELGYYFKAVGAYLDNFDKVKIVLYDDLFNNLKNILKELTEFLGAYSNFIYKIEKRNVSGIPKNKLIGYILKSFFMKTIIVRHVPYKTREILRNLLLKRPDLPDEYRRILSCRYRHDVERLAGLLDKDLSCWCD